MQITIKYPMYEKVQSLLSEDEMIVIGFEVMPNGVRYICSTGKMDYKYLYAEELKPLPKNRKIGFLTFNRE